MARRLTAARAATAASNIYRVVVLAALRSWWRNITTTSPALASLALLLIATGLCAILWTALENVLSAESAQASVLHVYLGDGAPPDAVASLRSRLAASPRVVSISYVSSEEALKQARSRPVLRLLLEDGSASPFPAELDVKVSSVADVAAVARSVDGDPAVDANFPTSYEGDAYRRLQTVMRYAQLGGGGVLALLFGVALVVSGNSVRSSLLARSEEIRIMWLVGSPGWVVRGPFLVEGAITGLLSGLLASGALALAIVVANSAQPVTVAQFLPGVDVSFASRLAAATIGLGVSVGAGSTVLGLARMKR